MFLGTSWTWVIGMYLPVLMVRDFGAWGWIVFAVPNVIGAAAMGWVVHERGQSERIVAAHRLACRTFSLVTLAFHAFFAIWFLLRLAPAGETLIILIVTGGVMVFLCVVLQRLRTAAAITYAVSIAMICSALYRGLLPDIINSSLRFPLDLLWLTPVTIFGFLLCPYLDLTFHRARQNLTSGEAQAAFGVGFGSFFLLMILFTLGYSGWIGGNLTAAAAWILFIHMAIQLLFTVAAHLRELLQGVRIARLGGWTWLVALAIGAAAGAVVGGTQYAGLSIGEVIYRLFMGFYGLIFPTYVLICMLPSRHAFTWRVMVWCITVLIAMPLFWMGFIEQQTVWLVPGMAVVLAGRGVMHLENKRAMTGGTAS